MAFGVAGGGGDAAGGIFDFIFGVSLRVLRGAKSGANFDAASGAGFDANSGVADAARM